LVGMAGSLAMGGGREGRYTLVITAMGSPWSVEHFQSTGRRQFRPPRWPLAMCAGFAGERTR